MVRSSVFVPIPVVVLADYDAIKEALVSKGTLACGATVTVSVTWGFDVVRLVLPLHCAARKTARGRAKNGARQSTASYCTTVP